MADKPVPKRKRKAKRSWSIEARERASIRAKEKYGKDAHLLIPPPSPSGIEAEGIRKEESMISDKYISKREFNYDDDCKFEQGQIVELRGFPNDEKLVKLNYVVSWDGKPEYEHSCIQCGKVFGSTSGYNAHVARHYDRCPVCDKEVSPDIWDKHKEAHAVLA